MTREYAQTQREAFNAFCDGKSIEGENNQGWRDALDPHFCTTNNYRIKPRAVEVTREKLAEAWDQTVGAVPGPLDSAARSVNFTKLCRALGLED